MAKRACHRRQVTEFLHWEVRHLGLVTRLVGKVTRLAENKRGPLCQVAGRLRHMTRYLPRGKGVFPQETGHQRRKKRYLMRLPMPPPARSGAAKVGKVAG
jgi:hypothetical protein